jgi:hypothetical protein
MSDMSDLIIYQKDDATEGNRPYLAIEYTAPSAFKPRIMIF